MNMKKFDIWIGYYNIDGNPPIEPELVCTIEALDFKAACMKYELLSVLRTIQYQESQGYVDNQTYEWFYKPHELTNTWTGKYFSSREEALETFK